ncbi:MAG: hypothetical protein HY076_07730 [Candidatus Eisenbacteria bacterium]|uniref:Uncharacterized protein n=1 Tax=Eiseniibacteriota bacterium TaxID=2212470 RepID=A0A9D6L745_UNCEI|nr:hypothetical protein [Candidatus Eisenbacteria bacterium]MBI3540148.1 hypothetical protein [Candidatus Eisenbacteria bacterium]
MSGFGHRFHRERIAGTIAVMALAIFSLTQCRMVEDRLTGVSVQQLNDREREGATHCIIQCQTIAAQAFIAEAQLVAANLKACNGDPACIQAENARHQAVVQTILINLRACIDSCHRQGGGDD